MVAKKTRRRSTTELSKWHTLQAVAALLLAMSLLIFVEFTICTLLYDGTGFGISAESARKIGLAYGPVFVVTFTALRDALDVLVTRFRRSSGSTAVDPKLSEVPWIEFANSWATMRAYALALLGSLGPMLAILLVSTGRFRVRTEWIVGSGAAIWALTAGDLIKKYLSQYAKMQPHRPPNVSELQREPESGSTAGKGERAR